MKTITEEDWQKVFQLRDTLLKQVHNRELFDYQKPASNKIIKAVLNNTGDTIAAEWTRQSGKTTCITDTVGFLLLFYFRLATQFNIKTTPQFNVGFFAPQLQQSQSAFNMLRDFLKACENQGFDFTFDSFNGNTIMMKSKSYPPRTVYCMTASPTSKQESKTLNLIIFDESQDLIDKVVDKAISPMGASTNAPEVWIGVGGYRKCRFLQHIEMLPQENKFIIPFNEVLKEKQQLFDKTADNIHLNYANHIKKRLREIGEDSDEFRTQYKLQWILERGQFITYDQLMSLEHDYEIMEEYMGVNITYGGIDWGKASDSTVMTVVNDKCHVIGWYEWQGDDYASQIEEIVWLIKNKYKSMKMLHCDSTGNQDMAVDILKAKFRGNINLQVVDVNFNASSKDEMYKNLSRLMQNKYVGGHLVQEAVFKFHKNDSLHKEKFIKQMIDLQKEIKNEKWRCNHPDAAGYHDDYCFMPDTMILTITGWKQIKDVGINDKVFTHQGNYKSVLKTMKREVSEEMLELIFENGSILKVTKNHPFLLGIGRKRRRKNEAFRWRRACNLMVNDYIKNHMVNNKLLDIRHFYYEGLVFNLEVEQDNSYLTKAGFVHNCDSAALACLGFLPRVERRGSYVPSIG